MVGQSVVVGVFPNVIEADRAVYEVLTRASLIVEVSVLSSGDATIGRLSMNAGVARGAAAGSIAGGVAGVTIMGVASAGLVSIHLLASLVAAGPAVATLAGVVAGAVAGAFIGSLVGASLQQPTEYAGLADAPGVAVSVHCESSDDIERAITALRQTGASDITERPEVPEDAGPSVRMNRAQAG